MKIKLVLVVISILLLAGCTEGISDNEERNDTELCQDQFIEIFSDNDLDILICKADNSVVAPEHETVYWGENRTYGFANTISSKYKVYIGIDVLTLSEFFASGILTDIQLQSIPFEKDLLIFQICDVNTTGYGYIEHIDSVTNLLDINIEDFYITEIMIHELNGELSLSGSGEWDTSYSVELTFDDIGEYLFPLLVSDVNVNDFSENGLGAIAKGQATVQIKLQSIEYSMHIQVYEDYIDVFLSDVENRYRLYNISDDLNNVDALLELIISEHTKTNK